jgi:flagellin FlaB
MYRWNKRTRDDRGQVGIGTLIVFIAMVLVAAIAAGVLINTAGFLQSSAEATGQDASDSTTNRLQVVSATGEYFTSDNAVGVVNITVKTGPGAGNVDLGETTVQWVGPSGSYYQLAASGSSDPPDGSFLVSAVQDDDNSIEGSQVLNNNEDRATITLDLGDNPEPIGSTSYQSFGEPLPEGETASVRIETPAGSVTIREIVVPQTISGTSAVQL